MPSTRKDQDLETAVEEVAEKAEHTVRKASAAVEKGVDKAAELAHDVTGKALSGAEQALQSTRNATNAGLLRAEQSLQSLHQHADPAIDELAHKALDLATKSINLVADTGERARQRVLELSEATNRYVTEQPTKALFFAAAAGAALTALLLGGRRGR